jgi:hypothetical protein
MLEFPFTDACLIASFQLAVYPILILASVSIDLLFISGLDKKFLMYPISHVKAKSLHMYHRPNMYHCHALFNIHI